MKIRKTRPLSQTIVSTQKKLNLLVLVHMIMSKHKVAIKWFTNLKHGIRRTWHLTRKKFINGTQKWSPIHIWIASNGNACQFFTSFTKDEASLRSIKVINKNYTCIQNQSLNHATRTITNLLIFATRDFGFDNTPYVPLYIRQYMIK